MDTVEINGLKFKKLLTYDEIHNRISEMAEQLKRDLNGKDPLFVCMLNGAAIFAADMMRALDTPAPLAFVKWKSYRGTGSTGEIIEELPLDYDVRGRNIVILEDIVDTGVTMYKFIEHVKKLGASSIKIVCLLCKPESIKYPIKVDYTGFEIGKAFVVGHGFDVDGCGRGLRDIYQLV